MKPILKYSILLVVSCILLLLVSSIIKGIKQKRNIENMIQTLPEFVFNNILGETFSSSDINKKNSSLIIYFHPECDHCHYEAEQISLNIDLFHNTQVIMISNASLESIKDFALKYHLLEFENINILIDTLDVFPNIFGQNPFPTSFIYNDKRKLVKQYKGEVTTEALLKYINR